MLFFVSIIILSFAHFLETASKPKISCERVSWLSTRTMNTPKQFLWARDALASRSKRMKECQKKEEPRKKCDAPIKNRILFSSSLLCSCFFFRVQCHTNLINAYNNPKLMATITLSEKYDRAEIYTAEEKKEKKRKTQSNSRLFVDIHPRGFVVFG